LVFFFLNYLFFPFFSFFLFFEIFLGLKITSCNFNYDLVRKAICSSYFINAAKIKNIGDYNNLRTGMPCKSKKNFLQIYK
jgi:hypothetical protein